MKDLIRKFKIRGRHFLEIAEFSAKKGRYDLALFHLEQSLQLLLKSKLLEKYGDFPKTHGLKELFSLVSKFKPKLKTMIKKNILSVDILEDAYIAARYLGSEYGKEEYEICKKFVKKLWELLK